MGEQNSYGSAQGINTINPSSYELEVLTIVNNEGDGFDIRETFVRLNLYESITSNFLLGDLSVADATAFLDTAKLFGQESLRLRFRQNDVGGNTTTEDQDTIDQLFRIYKIDDIQRSGDDIQSVRIHFCSPELITSRRKKISQALRGSLSDIATKIAVEHLGIVYEQVDHKLQPYFEAREQSQGDNYHVVIPNWSVNHTINWLCKQAQGDDSTSGIQDSFFFYQTAVGGYRLQSMKTMMGQKYGGGRPFVYAAATMNDGRDENFDSTTSIHGQGRKILNYNVTQHADVFSGIINGLWGSKQTTINNTYKFYTEKTYSFLEKHFGGSKDSIDEHPFVRTLPETLYAGDAVDEKGDVTKQLISTSKPISSYPDSFCMLTSDSSFVNDDKNNIHQADHMTHLGSSQFRNATKQLLEYHTLNAVLSARTDISVGQLINLDIPLPDPGQENDDPVFYNGDHLITEIRWTLTKTECKTNIKCIKDSLLNNMETTIINYGEVEE